VNPAHKGALNGMKFFSMKNRKGSAVISSTKNFFDSYQIKKIKCDEGCTCTVLPIENIEMLLDLFKKYRDSCNFSIILLNSVGGQTLGLSISDKLSSPKFEFRIGLDIFPNDGIYTKCLLDLFDSAALTPVSSGASTQLADSSSTTVSKDEGCVIAAKSSHTADDDQEVGDQQISSSNYFRYQCTRKCCAVNFFLCSEDITFLLSEENGSLMEILDLTNTGVRVRDFFASGTVLKRRNSALLGNDFLGRSEGTISFGRVKFYMDLTVHKLEACTWNMMSEIVESIVQMQYLSSGSVDFEILDSIEPNDIFGVVGEETADSFDIWEDV